GATGTSGAATGSGGLLSAVGGKAGVAIAGAAIARTAAAGVGVYAVTRPDRDHVVAAAATPTPSGQRMSFGTLSITAPVSWKLALLTRLPGRPKGDYWVNSPGACSPSTIADYPGVDKSQKAYENNCPGFVVIGEPWRNDTTNGWRDFTLTRPWGPETEAFRTCPHRGDLNGIGTEADRAKPVRTGTARVGTRTAQYREWRIHCLVLQGADQFKPTSVTYVQRFWYLTGPKLLILDEWNTPNLDKILAKATWA
ncbi:hypothetical protein, partial [Actinomadura napierensis]|uniref:hypothetical protein n=1 Tax=Actinomadura napierensis TaxID=267854 RepID=UPI0031DDEB32